MSTEAKQASRNASRVRLRVPDRSQVEMKFQCVEDLLPASHPARTVWAVSQRLDMSGFEKPIKAREGVAGRDATAPHLLFALWLYATTQGVGSARKLARLCRKHDDYKWLCGDVTVNHRMLSDFRTDHGQALDDLLTTVVASLVDKELVKVHRISQDGTRVRACAGAASFRREERLDQLLAQARAHVQALKAMLADPAASGGLSARQKAARRRVARERVERLEAAVAQLPQLKAKQEQAVKKAGQGKRGQSLREKQPRVSSTDPEARVMKMPNGGFNPAVNVQLAVDTESRAIVGVAVCNEGSDSADLSGPMRQQVERRTGRKVQEHLLDGGYLKLQDIENAQADSVALFVPPKQARREQDRGHELDVRAGDSEAIVQWKERMSSESGKAVYRQRAATSETVNADLKTHRGLVQLTVRGLAKAKCVALWCALAYNVMHFAGSLLS